MFDARELGRQVGFIRHQETISQSALESLGSKEAGSKFMSKKSNTDVGQFLTHAKLMGSRGCAMKYGRPQPEGRDYDYVAFTDDRQKKQELIQLLRNLSPQGYRMIERPGGFLTASGNNIDLSVYPTTKQTDIHKAWGLQERGLSKDEAWAQLDADAMEKEAGAAWRTVGNLTKLVRRLQPHGSLNNTTRSYQLAVVRSKLFGQSPATDKTSPMLKSLQDRLSNSTLNTSDLNNQAVSQIQSGKPVQTLYRGHTVLDYLPSSEWLGTAKTWRHGSPFPDAAAGYAGSLRRETDLPGIRGLMSAFSPLPNQKYSPGLALEFVLNGQRPSRRWLETWKAHKPDMPAEVSKLFATQKKHMEQAADPLRYMYETPISSRNKALQTYAVSDVGKMVPLTAYESKAMGSLAGELHRNIKVFNPADFLKTLRN